MVKTFVEVKGYTSKREVKKEISGYYSPKRNVWIKPHTRKTKKTVFVKGYFRKQEKKQVTKVEHIQTKNYVLCQVMAKKEAEQEIENREKRGIKVSESEKKRIEKQSFKSVWDTFLINHWKTQKLDDKQVTLFISLFY